MDDNEIGSRVRDENIYKERVKPVLVSLLELYSKLNLISIGTGRPSLS